MAKKTPRQPALFNPKLVCALSLLFTPIFGAALQARNWTELGKTHEAAASRFWVRSTVWLLILFVVVQTLFRNEEIMSWFGPYFLVVLWGAYIGKKFYSDKKSLLPALDGKWNGVLCSVGRHTVWVYLFHQPVVAGIILFFGLINGLEVF